MEQVEVVVLAAAVVVMGPGSSKSGSSSRSGVVRRNETIRCQGPIAVCVALRKGLMMFSFERQLEKRQEVGVGSWASGSSRKADGQSTSVFSFQRVVRPIRYCRAQAVMCMIRLGRCCLLLVEVVGLPFHLSDGYDFKVERD